MDKQAIFKKSGSIAAAYLEMFLLRLSQCETTSSKQIHRFRLATKRLRSIENLLNTNRDSSSLISMSDSLYSSSGDIRTFQLNMKICAELKVNDNKVLDKHWKNQLLNAKEKFMTQKNLFDHDEFIKEAKLAIHSLKEIEDEELERILNKAIVSEENLLLTEYNQSLEHNNAHGVRKHLKNIVHLNDIIETYFSDAPKRGYISSAIEVAEKIGKWHDFHVLIKEVENFRSKLKTSEDLVRRIQLICNDLLIRSNQRMLSLADSLYLDIAKKELR